MERKGTKLVFLTDWLHHIIVRRHLVRDADVVTKESLNKRDSLATEYEETQIIRNARSGLLVAAYGRPTDYGDSADLAIG